jgi:hypothetical protein
LRLEVFYKRFAFGNVPSNFLAMVVVIHHGGIDIGKGDTGVVVTAR